MDGYVCVDFTVGTWGVKAWTQTFYPAGVAVEQYEVAVSAHGADRCGNDAFVYQTWDYTSATWQFWSGWADDWGAFLDCPESKPHQYRAHSWHYRRSGGPTSPLYQIDTAYWYL